MNEAHDRLETELRGLRPHEPSAELREQIAERLGSIAVARSRRRWRGALWGAAVAGGLAAAWLVAVLLLRRESDVVIEPEPQEAESLQPLLASALDDSLPTVGTYRRALARSPDELEAMLDRHTARSMEREPSLPHVRAFIRLDEELDTLRGEL